MWKPTQKLRWRLTGTKNNKNVNKWRCSCTQCLNEFEVPSVIMSQNTHKTVAPSLLHAHPENKIGPILPPYITLPPTGNCQQTPLPLKLLIARIARLCVENVTCSYRFRGESPTATCPVYQNVWLHDCILNVASKWSLSSCRPMI